MPAGILIIRTDSGDHARELVDELFGVASIAVGEELLTCYGTDPETWWHPLAWTIEEQAFFRRFFGGGVSQSEPRKTEMVTTMERAKQIFHATAAAVGLVDSAEEISAEDIARAAREKNRLLFAQLPEATEAMRAAARNLEAVNQKITSGEMHIGADRQPGYIYRDAASRFRVCQQARTALIDSAPVEVRTRRQRKKRELVSTSTRINLLTRQQIPSLEMEITAAKATSAAADRTAKLHSHNNDLHTRKDAARQAELCRNFVVDKEIELETLQLELASLEEKADTLQAEVTEIDRQILES